MGAPTPPFDAGYPAAEQIPRRLVAEFTPDTGPFGPVVHLTVNGHLVGDPLTDRGWSETGYRWHDALHLAHAVCLGWSPVLRSLAHLQRQSHPKVRHIEDGGRAIVADEAIAWATFCYARTHRWLPDGPPAVLLDRIEEMTYGLEVTRCPRYQWRNAISSGLRAMLALWHADGGTLYGDLDTATLKHEPPAAASA